ncbi:MAG: helicase [Desulfuromonas sp.]|uniref:helicase-related protein n=1 Tax=Desulfuromonas sp. TaxID=892 RepID=UPI000CBE5165|nr:helicase-related protein [Desulfuromonas sp.]PLX85598.1 MAG: helicase [Desulfuromonas sp.]
MNNLLHMATVELSQYLSVQLPELADDWWNKHVVGRLSFQQQRMVENRGFKTLQELDFAALLRIMDQNWFELSNTLNLPREGRTWLKELQTVRNKWAHLSAETMPASEIYRDADTLGRLMGMLGAGQVAIDTVEATKSEAVAAMADSICSVTPEPSASSLQQVVAIAPESKMTPVSASEQMSAKPASLFKVGDLVALRSNPSELMPVLEIIPGGGECRYSVFHNNSKTTYYESQLLTPVEASEEHKILTVKQLQAHLTSLQILSPSTTNLFSLRSGRVQFVPYQYRPVMKLIRSDRPRLLIADEVGVGKTIEAGLIIKELRARMELSSVLVICPKALVAERKWANEMKRFDENFTALDGPLLRHCLNETHLDGEWPDQYSKAILPFSLFDSKLVFGPEGRKKKRDQGLLSLEPPPKFDLVIVDEAHHIRNSDTFLHQGVRYFCDHAQAVLLLTATPVQLGSSDLFTLLNVLRPDLIIDHASFRQMAEPNGLINQAVQHCRTGQDGWQHDARGCLDDVAQTEWGRLFLRESPTFQNVYDKLGEDDLGDKERVELTHAIESLYTFSPLINRTRRRDIGEFTTRKPETVTVDFTSDQKELHNELLDIVARILTFCHGQKNVKFMMTTIRRQAASCLYGLAPMLQDLLVGKLDQIESMEASDNDTDIDLGFVSEVRSDVEDLLEKARHLEPYDPKIEAFMEILVDKSKLENNKALVFSTFRHTLAYLAVHTEKTGLRYGLIHGNVPDDERAELRRRFALPKEHDEAIDILLSSEVGCEGLDFQFCDFLVNYDLPWNPMRIEQRIGRIDRYGQQSETVAIINFVTPGTVDADIYGRCLWRIGVFQHAVGGSEEILGEITQKIHDIADSFVLTTEEREQRLKQLADNGIRQVREEQELETKQAELFGLNVPKQTWQEEIEAAETFWLSQEAIQGCVRTYLAERLEEEVEHLLGEKPLKTLRISQQARNKLLADYKKLKRSNEPMAREWEKWLKGAHPTISITFDQEVAAENPKAIHLSVAHPLVRQAAHCLRLDDPVDVAISVQHTDLPPGEHHFAIYRWKKQGVKSDETLIAVAARQEIENALLTLLQMGSDNRKHSPLSISERDTLDMRHHLKWTEARGNHIAENRQIVELRAQSLTVSHQARCKAIGDQLAVATNDKIRLMKEGELARANADFSRHMEQVQQAAERADILAVPAVFGTLEIVGGGQS